MRNNKKSFNDHQLVRQKVNVIHHFVFDRCLMATPADNIPCQAWSYDIDDKREPSVMLLATFLFLPITFLPAYKFLRYRWRNRPGPIALNSAAAPYSLMPVLLLGKPFTLSFFHGVGIIS